MAERIYKMSDAAWRTSKSFGRAQVFFAVFHDRCKGAAVQSLHIGKSEASAAARKIRGCVRPGIVDGARFVVGRVPAEPDTECIAALAKDPRALVIKNSLMASAGKSIEGPGILREERLVYASGTLTDKGREAHASGLRHEERMLAEIAEAHPIGDDGKPHACVRTLVCRDPIDPRFSMETSEPEGIMLAPYVYRETCASVGVSGEIGAYDSRVTWRRERHGTQSA